MLFRWLVVAAMVLTFGIARADVDPRHIESALDRAKAFLYKEQTGDNWERDLEHHGDQKTGYTALAVYALLTSGESHTEPRIEKAIEYLKKTDTTGVYALGMRCQVWLHLPQTPEVKRAMNKDATALRSNVITEGDGRGFYGYNPGLRPWSHSRAQYAVLGLWAAAESRAIEVPNAYWQLVEKAWIDDQDPSGGWSYQAKPNDQYPLTPGMTAIGVATLYITQDFLHAAEAASPRGNIVNPNIDRGMKWMIDNFSKVASDEQYPRDFPYATIYAVQRIGVASGLKYFGKIDWYDKGAQWLLSKQYNDGRWPSEYGNVTSTSFAMLFLARGRAPIAFNKLDYTLESSKKAVPWNQRPRDMANLSRWIGRQLEKDINWQIVNLSAPVEDWHESPILYLSGNDEIALDDSAKQKLKRFIEQGGLVLGNADVQARNFVNSYRKLGQELFPAYEFRELPAEHVIYTNQQFPRAAWKNKPTVLGLSNGVRELMILLPQGDFARSWQTQTLAGKEEQWQLGSNIFLSCVDQQNLRKRGQTYLIARNDRIKADKSAKIARLRYAGNWDPEPAGWQRLSNLLHNRHKLDIEIKTIDLDKETLEGVKLAHLTGTGKIKLDEPVKAKLKSFVESGGTLVIDAAGGSSEFASSIEQELGAIFPGATLTTLAKDHAIFKIGTPMKSFGYRPHASRILGSLKDEPRLRAIELNDRPAVIFSREDLSAGLVGQTVDGIVGYDPTTASEIMSRIVQQAAK